MLMAVSHLKMAAAGCVRARIALLLTVLQLSYADEFIVPRVTFKALKPKGLEVSVPDHNGMTYFAFNGNINRQIESNGVGNLKGEVLDPNGPRWVYRNNDIELKPGDVINYYIFVTHNRVGYLKDNLKYTVIDLVDEHADTEAPAPQPPKPAKDCKPTATILRGGKACSGDVIFEDNFDSLRPDLWRVEQYIPVTHPDYPFVSYQIAADGVVTIHNGQLRITPKLQEAMAGFTNESIYSGHLDLFNSCTASAEACQRQASGPAILPPVVSGRVTSSSFAFTYGQVYIKAKLPQGDWIYPELLLEPFLKKYGRSNYGSGVIKIACARGNKELRAAPDEYGNKVLYGGPVMDFQCRHELLSNKIMTGGKLWGDDFHVYSVKWTPDQITLFVDDEEWARVESVRPLRDQLKRCSNIPRMLLSRGTNLAPFDDYFFLTLGVAVGGISEFRDHTYTTGGTEKPWINSSPKAMLNFWEQLDTWKGTWTQPELLVDYVKVVAL